MAYTGPYSIVAKCGACAFYLKDHYGHKLLCSMPASHLVWFYDKGVYKNDDVSSIIQPTSSDPKSEEPGNLSDTCQRVHSQDSQNKTSTPKKNHGMILLYIQVFNKTVQDSHSGSLFKIPIQDPHSGSPFRIPIQYLTLLHYK